MYNFKKVFKFPSKSNYFSSKSASPLQMYEEIMEMCMKFTLIIGANIFHSNHRKLNLNLVLTIIYLNLTFVLNVYDVYIFRDDLVRDIFCVLSISAEIQSYAKVYVFIFLKKNCTALKIKGENFFKKFNNKKSNEIFEIWMMRTAHIGVLIFFLFIVTTIIIITYPIIYYLIAQERILHFGFEIPMLDWKSSWFAYSLNFFHQASSFILFVIASIPSIVIIVIYIMTSLACFDILSILLKDLNEIAIKNENGCKNKDIKEMIKFILEVHLELIE